MESQFLDCINKIRAENGKEPFIIDSRLQVAAQKHADFMYEYERLSHSEGWGGLSFSERIEKEGFQASSCAENIAWGAETIEEVLEMWLKSAGHRANLLGNYDFCGIAKASSYWCHDFANLQDGA